MKPVFLVLLLSCQKEETPPVVSLLDARGELTRLSVDLRGVHPSEAELLAIEANPALYDQFVDRYLDDPRFLDRIKEIFNLRYLTRTGDVYFSPADAGLGLDDGTVADALAEEPLELVSHIVEQDLPFTDIVLADYTMANPITAKMWDIDYPDGKSGWQEAHYNDGRPEAGILTMTTIWQAYPSMGGNANRHRANAVSRMLLCSDYLDRPIVLNRAAVDQLTVDPETAIATSDTCQSCHSTLDPLAAHFYGFFHEDMVMDLREATTYLPENEENWRLYADKPPGYFGEPTTGITELAEDIASDPRFADCAVQTVFEGLTQRTMTDDDWPEMQYYEDRFVGNGYRIKDLVKDIVTTDYYKAASATDPALDDRLATVKTVSPYQLASIIEDLTGFRWQISGRDALTTQDYGLPVLTGGVDGKFVRTASYDPSVGLSLVSERLSQAAAYQVASADLAVGRTGDAKLLAYVTVNDTPDSAADAFDTQIRDLYLRITGRALADDATEPAELTTLWKQVYSIDASPTAAWASVISAVLRDPAVLFY